MNDRFSQLDDEDDLEEVDECLLLRAGDFGFGDGELLRSARAEIN